MDKTRIPVIVGTGQVTDTTSKPEEGRSPLQLMHDAVKLAAADSGAQDQGAALLRGLDSVTVIRLFADTLPRFASPFGKLANAPWSIAQRVGAANATDLVCPPQGGDSLVMLARACERIAQGESQAALVVGGEALRTELAAKRAGLQLQWGEDAPTTPNQLTGVRSFRSTRPEDMYTKAEEKHGMRSAIAMYALIGQALRHAAGQTVDQYREASAKLFARFAAVARDNPLATRRKGYSAEQIAEVNAENPFVGFPYTKLMTASVFVDQSAAFIVVSEARADELGIPQDKRVYLHGEAHAHNTWFVSDRERLDQSPAMRLTSRAALAQAMRQRVQPAVGARPCLRLARVGVDDQVQPALEVVEHRQLVAEHQQDVGRAQLVRLRVRAQARLDVFDALEAEPADQAAGEAGQAIELRHLVQRAQAFDFGQRVFDLTAFHDFAVFANFERMATEFVHPPRRQADDRIAAEAFAALHRFEQVGMRAVGQLQVDG